MTIFGALDSGCLGPCVDIEGWGLPTVIVPAPSVTSLSVVTTGFVAGLTDGKVPLPDDGEIAGDIMLLFNVAGAPSGTPSDSTPSGWVAGPNIAQTGIRAKVMAGVLNGTDISNEYIQGLASTGQQHAAYVIGRPDATVASLTMHGPGSDGFTNGNPSSKLIEASGGDAPLVVFCGYTSSGAIDPRSWSGSTPTEIEIASSRWFLFGLFNSSPAGITVDMDDEGNNNALLPGWLEVA